MKKHVLGLICSTVILAMVPQVVMSQSMEMTSAKLYMKQEEWDKAIHWLQQALKKKPEHAEAHYLLGKVYGMRGRYREMAAELTASEKYDKKRKYAKDIANLRQHFLAQNFNAGLDAFRAQDFEKASTRFAIASLLDPTSVASHQNLAIAYRQFERQLQSQQPCDSCGASGYEWDPIALKCRDQDSNEFTETCCCGDQVGEFFTEAIVGTYKHLMEIQPDSLSNYLALVDFYKSRKDFEAGAELLAAAYEKFPNNGKILSELAILYDFMGQSDKAFATYEEALKARPEDPDLRFNFGRLYFMREDFPEAIEQFKLVFEANPDDFEANFNAGVSYLKIGETLDKQLRELEDEAAMNKTRPDQATVDSLRSQSKVNFEAAVPYLEKAAELQPNEQAVWFNLGVGYTRMGDAEKAKAAFDKADELNAQN